MKGPLYSPKNINQGSRHSVSSAVVLVFPGRTYVVRVVTKRVFRKHRGQREPDLILGRVSPLGYRLVPERKEMSRRYDAQPFTSDLEVNQSSGNLTQVMHKFDSQFAFKFLFNPAGPTQKR